MIVNFEDSFHNQMKWINEAVGGTRDMISVISILLGHIVQLTIMLLMMIFCGSPLLSKTTMVVLLPMNCVLALQEKHHFTYKEMFVLVALTYPGKQLNCYIIFFTKNIQRHLLVAWRVACAPDSKCFKLGVWNSGYLEGGKFPTFSAREELIGL